MKLTKEEKDIIIEAKENILKELEKINLILIETDNIEYNRLRNVAIPFLLHINMVLLQEVTNG